MWKPGKPRSYPATSPLRNSGQSDIAKVDATGKSGFEVERVDYPVSKDDRPMFLWVGQLLP